MLGEFCVLDYAAPNPSDAAIRSRWKIEFPKSTSLAFARL
jgi:hypothetical protein